jgi:hypothetical protein
MQDFLEAVSKSYFIKGLLYPFEYSIKIILSFMQCLHSHWFFLNMLKIKQSFPSLICYFFKEINLLPNY